MASPDRFDFDDSLTSADVQRLCATARLQVVQTVAPVKQRTWQLLNDELLPARPDVQLRAYGHYGLRCDLRLVRHIPNVRRFSADCLRDADHLEALAELPQLEELGVGVYGAQSFAFLKGVPAGLRKLFLGATRSKKPGLAPLEPFGGLTTLSLEGQSKNIEVVSRLRRLEDVTLRSITTPSLSYLRPLGSLLSLAIKLGGIRDLSAIDCLQGLRYLELWMIRELHDISVISRLGGLQALFLQDLPHVKAFPSLQDNRSLRSIYVLNLSGLRDLGALETAPALERFSLHVAKAKELEPSALLPALRNPTVRFVSASLGNMKKNAECERLRKLHGKDHAHAAPPFAYR